MRADGTLDALLARVVARFLETAHQIAPDDLAGLIASSAKDLGAAEARVWLADHQLRALVHLAVDDPREPQPIDGSIPGRAFITSEIVESPSEASTSVWFPLLDGVDRIGVLEVELPELPDERRRAFQTFASMATAEIVSRGQYTDSFTATRRLEPMSLSAEMQWQQLPPNSFTTSDVAVAGMMEPAYEIGGDSYDYAHDSRRLRFAIFDAVGHDLRSSLISTLTMTAYRHARRSEAGLLDAGAAIDDAIFSQFGGSLFTTGQLGDLDTDTGVLRWLNAGHPPPLAIRRGQVTTLEGHPRLPFGLAHMGHARPVEVNETHLQPGDAVLLYTDGVIEARRAEGEDFGIDRLSEFLHTAYAAEVAPAETLRRLSNAVLDFHDGALRDDATTLLVVWQPNAPR